LLNDRRRSFLTVLCFLKNGWLWGNFMSLKNCTINSNLEVTFNVGYQVAQKSLELLLQIGSPQKSFPCYSWLDFVKYSSSNLQFWNLTHFKANQLMIANTKFQIASALRRFHFRMWCMIRVIIGAYK
jgi:hypothetical protein